MSRDFVGALLQLNAEKQVSREQLIGAVEDGIQSAYRRVAGDEDIHVRDRRRDAARSASSARAASSTRSRTSSPRSPSRRPQAIEPDAELGDLVETEQLDGDVFGRIGAQTAKQIVLQRIREVERDQVFDQFAAARASSSPARSTGSSRGRSSSTSARTSRRSSPRPSRARSSTTASARTSRRTCSRSAARPRARRSSSAAPTRASCKRLFELEVPEIHSGTVEIKAIAREAGSRSKVAVASRQDGLDPVGATVGQRGARVQAVVAELAGEKIDVIPWNDDPAVFVANALSPAQVISRRHRRGAPDRERDRARADALAGDRPRGPERPARGAADRLADRHPQRRLGRRGQGRRRERRAGRGRADAAEAAPRPPTPAADARRPRAKPRPAERPTKPKRRRRDGATDEAERRDRAEARAGRRRRDAATNGADGRRQSRSDAAAEGARPSRGAPPSAEAAAADRAGRRRAAKPKRADAKARTPPRRWRRRPAPPPADRARAPVPTRTCVACRTVRPKRELVRIVRTPDGDGRRSTRPAGSPAAAPTSAATAPASTSAIDQGRPRAGARDPAPGRPARALAGERDHH